MSQRNIQTQVQQQQQVQQQTLTPQQVMVVRLTEMPLEALQQRVEIECLENPWLEKKQDDSDYGTAQDHATKDQSELTNDYRSEDDIPDYLLGPTKQGGMAPEDIEYGDTLSFYDQLKNQIADFDLTEHEATLLEYLIGSLEDDGLLKKPLYQLADEAEIYQGIATSEEELERLLHILWQFDPAGIGARSLQECLLIQIRRDTRNPLQSQMEQVMERCYDDFIHNRWHRIQERLKLTSSQADALRHELLRLNPKPGAAMGEAVGRSNQHITPDFIVETDAYGHITLSLNQGDVPDLVISSDATDKLAAYDAKPASAKGTREDDAISKAIQEDIRFTRQYVERGQMFINALAQRRESMIRTMQAIIKLQRPFFLEGNEMLLRPMILEDVATLAGYDISTISRVSNSKYVQTSFGTFPLKWFFTQKAIQTADGDTASSRQAMIALKELIEAESPTDRLSDERLATMMKAKGYNIARRTVAKYREQMGIPVARMRR